MFQISITTLFAFLLIAPTAITVCYYSNEIDGLCSYCSPPAVLKAGFCLPHIPGCLTQISPNLCSSCATGYTLTNNFCVPSITTSSNPSANIAQYLQTYGDRGPNYKYQLLDFHLKSKYNAQLNDKISNISLVQQLKTTYGFIYSLTYMNPFSNGGLIYRAEALVDYFHVIKEYQFKQISETQLTDFSSLLWILQRKIIAKNIPTLNNIVLNQVEELTSNNYRLFYISFKGQIYVQDIQRKDDPTTSLSFAELTQLYYSINENTVINYVFSLFPNFQLHTTYTINFYTLIDSNGNENLYYKFIFDSQIIVIVQAQGLLLKLYSYEQPDNVENISNPQSLGGFLPFSDLQDPSYLEVYTLIVNKYPILSTKTIKSVRYQMVSGVNFMIELDNEPFSHDIYVIIANKPLKGYSPSITSIHKNGVDISNTIVSNQLALPGAFNYEADQTFKGVYQHFRDKVQFEIGSLLPILSVQYVVGLGSVIDYLVIFTQDEVAYLQYNPSDIVNKNKIKSFTSFGVNIPLTGTSLAPILSTRDVVLTYLKQIKPSLFTTYIVVKYHSETNYDKNNYQVDILTQHGIYFTRVHQQGILYPSKISQISTQTCGDLHKSQFIANTAIASLNTFILANYIDLAGCSLVLVQGYISTEGKMSYRMVYAFGTSRHEVQIIEQFEKFYINKLTHQSGINCKQTEMKYHGKCESKCSLFVF